MEQLLPADCAHHDRCEGIHDQNGRPLVEVGTLAHRDVIDYGNGRVTVEKVMYGSGPSEGRVLLTYWEHADPSGLQSIWLDGHSIVARVPYDPRPPRPQRRRRLILAASAAVLALAAFGAGWATHTPDRPSCPTEDSCDVDYRDGRWVVVEVTP